MAILPLFLLPLKALFTCLKPLLCTLRFHFFQFLFADLGFGNPVVLHQWNFTRTDIGTGTTFNAVEQVVLFQFVVLFAFGKPLQLLREQGLRTGISTGATTNTSLLRACNRQLLIIWCKNTVGGFNHRNTNRWQRKAHHRATHNNTLLGNRFKALAG